MATTPILGLTKVEVGQGNKEATINGDLDILDNAVSGNASGAIWARAYHSATQSLTNATATAISLNSERWDTNVIHDLSTNNSRLTCKTAGVYLITGGLGYAFHATGARQTSIRLSGTTYLAHNLSPAVTTNTLPTRHVVTTVYRLAVNDYVELIGYQESGGGAEY